MNDIKLRKIVGFYHRGDLDGVSSGAIMSKMFKDQDLTLIGVEYGDTIDEAELTKDADLVYVCDYTFEPFDRMLKLNKEKNLIWVDHHKSSLNYANVHPEVKFKGVLGDNTKSACELLWEYFYPNIRVPYAISKISLFDTWQHNFADDILNFYYGAEIKSEMNPESKFWKDMFSDVTNTGTIQDIIDAGVMIRSYNSMKDASYARDHAFETEFEGFKAIVINIGFAGSFKFKSVYDATKHDIMVAFSRRANHIWKISVYSEKNYVDCSAICKKYGGGGHKGAAGFEVKTDELPFKI
jgi:oligoribonuclease NrnB/cAMP/cGMP phosphodiesterase (DHH superfamily)